MHERAARIQRLLGRFEGLNAPRPEPRLRRKNRVRTIRGSVGIEGNTLSLEQVTAVLGGQRIAGSAKEIREVVNANTAYSEAASFKPWSVESLLRAHGLLMQGLVTDAGRFRSGSVGVVQGRRVVLVAPQAQRVPTLVRELLSWGRTQSRDRLVAACVVHYELLFIHPFSDGNGRLARLWQLVVLLGESPLFEVVPVETVIRERQAEYYRVLRECGRAGESTAFVEFVLAALGDAMEEVVASLRPARGSPDERLALARAHFHRRSFTRADYLAVHPALSPLTASRDLARAVKNGALRRSGDKRLARYVFVG
jgi:Fic family protein